MEPIPSSQLSMAASSLKMARSRESASFTQLPHDPVLTDLPIFPFRSTNCLQEKERSNPDPSDEFASMVSVDAIHNKQDAQYILVGVQSKEIEDLCRLKPALKPFTVIVGGTPQQMLPQLPTACNHVRLLCCRT